MQAPVPRMLKSGDRLILYTDGVTEAMNKKGDMFGMDRLNQVIARADEDPGKLLTTINQSVAEHSADFPQSDDLTMVCLAVD